MVLDDSSNTVSSHNLTNENEGVDELAEIMSKMPENEQLNEMISKITLNNSETSLMSGTKIHLDNSEVVDKIPETGEIDELDEIMSSISHIIIQPELTRDLASNNQSESSFNSKDIENKMPITPPPTIPDMFDHTENLNDLNLNVSEIEHAGQEFSG